MNNFLFFLCKPSYSRFEVFIMTFIIFFIMVIYNNIIDFTLRLDYFSLEYLLKKMYLSWVYLISSICIVSYAKIVQNEEFDLINIQFDKIDNKIGELNGRS